MPKERSKCKAAEGCDQDALKMDFCNTHYTQVKRGARSPEGHLLRELRASYKGGVLCKVEGCKKGAFAVGLCNPHYQQHRFNRIDTNGKATDPSTWTSYFNPNRTTPGTAGPCKIEGCTQQRVDTETALCGKHYQRLNLGIIDRDGNILREEYRVRRYTAEDKCKVSGCGKQARSNFFCVYHAGRFSTGAIDSEGNTLREPVLGKPKKKNPRWISSTGYVYVRAPEGHPYANSDGMIFEHRLVMEQKIGRPLEPWELVHHKDGNKQHNDPSNLEVMDRRAGHGEGHPRALEPDLGKAVQTIMQQNEHIPDAVADFLQNLLHKERN